MEACFPRLGVRKRREPPPPVEAIPSDPHQGLVAAAARTFSFDELAAATRNFRGDYLVSAKEAALYKGYLKSVNQVVAIKQQDAADGRRSSEKCNSEFLAHVLKLSALRHPNLVSLIGFCADGNHRILVHEYMPLGSLEDHIHDLSPDKARLDWSTRMNIAAGAAKGLAYLHENGLAYRCMRSSDILLGDGDGDGYGYHPKLSQCGLAELSQLLSEHGEPFAKQYYGFSAPEIAMTGRRTAASSVYSFGVVLLEMITGRRAIIATEYQNIVIWARPLVKYRGTMRRMADPALQGRYPPKDLERAIAVATVCVQHDPAMIPPIGDVVKALALLASPTIDQAESQCTTPN